MPCGIMLKKNKTKKNICLYLSRGIFNGGGGGVDSLIYFISLLLKNTKGIICRCFAEKKLQSTLKSQHAQKCTRKLRVLATYPFWVCFMVNVPGLRCISCYPTETPVSNLEGWINDMRIKLMGFFLKWRIVLLVIPLAEVNLLLSLFS